jgi:amino acid adenylation domain-containing protein
MNQNQQIYDLTQSQLLMWTGQKLNPEAPLYNMVLVFDFQREIKVEAFQRAFQKLLHQSDALRTTFSEKEGVPKQIVHSEFHYPLEFIDWTNEKGDFKEWVTARSQQMFDLSECCFDSILIKKSTTEYTWYFNQHHLITDAWAVGVLFKKMAELYENEIAENTAEITLLPTFDQYLKFENKTKTDPKNADIHAYWNSKLNTMSSPPRLYGYTCSEAGTRSYRVVVELGQERSTRLRELTKEADIRAWTQDMALFNIFSTALFAYIYKVSGQRNLVIGTPSHNRLTPAFKKTPGVFIELFPMQAEVKEGDSLGGLFQGIRNESFEFMKHVRPGASSAILNRSFNVVLNYIHADYADFGTIKSNSEWVHPNHCDPRHHLRLQVHDFDDSGNIHLNFDLNAEVFNEEMRANAPHHFLEILDAFIKDRSQNIEEINLVGEKESEQLLNAFKGKDNPELFSKNVVQLFENQAIENPVGTAIFFKKLNITYQYLDRRSNRLAHYLIENGLQKGDRVALFLKRSPELIISILATLKAGGTYIPIASNYPSERAKMMVEEVEAKFVLTHSEMTPRFKSWFDNCSPAHDLNRGTAPIIFELDTNWQKIAQYSQEKPAIEISKKDLAYIMFTSGSTGRPKGVMISHKALSNYISWAQKMYVSRGALKSALDKVTLPLFTMIGFDLTVTSLYLPLITGGKMVIYEEADSGPDLALQEVIQDNLVDLIKLTPSHLALLKDQDLSHSRIKTMIVGGEDFKTELAENIQNAFGNNLRIFNEYGPTEATVGCVLHQFNSKSDTQSSVPIGKSGDNVQVLILDKKGNIVPQGVVGELYISGDGVAEGYWNQPEMTAEKFVQHPSDESRKMYRTGDLVRLNQSGDLEFLGRIDEQMKIGGIRIEPAEIESALAKHPDIQNVVVELRKRPVAPTFEEVEHCKNCGLPSNYPNVEFDDDGICNICHSFESYQSKTQEYFKTLEDLKAIFEEGKKRKKGEYDCIMLLSGGKDSTYALGQLKEMGLNVLAFTLDNGYISQQALDNVQRVAKQLEVDCVVGKTPAMNEIFADSLDRHCNVCNGCFKTIYTLSTKIALERGIPFIVTGLSRGQFFETRLTEELFMSDRLGSEDIDEIILNARKEYHQVNDAVNQLLDVSMFKDETVFDEVQFIDFYRYTDVSLEEMYVYLNKKVPWIRPTDTGRSTNCIINKVGIYVHTKTKGYSNYAFPYSWDVRVGHKTRDEALDEINEPIDEQEVKQIMSEIGYTENTQTTYDGQQLVAFYVSGSEIEPTDLRAFLANYLPEYMIPTHFQRLEAMPLTPNGKIDRKALPKIDFESKKSSQNYIEPETQLEEMLAEMWEEVLQIERIGIKDDFLELGGTSLAAIRLTARINETFEMDIPLKWIFEKRNIEALAEVIEAEMERMMAEET